MLDLGNILTACAILISAAGLLFSMRKDQALRMREQANQIRDGVSAVVAKLDRWKQLSLHLFDELQIAATSADAILVKNKDLIEARDFFWKEAVESQARIRAKVLDERIEISYSRFYGYDPKIHDFYGAAVAQLRKVDRCSFISMLNQTQDIVVAQIADEQGDYTSSRLGNALRACLMEQRVRLRRDMDAILDAFRNRMLDIVRASDRDLVNKKVPMPSPDLILALENESVRDARANGSRRDSRHGKCIDFWSEIVMERFTSDPRPGDFLFPEHVKRVRPV